MKVHIVFAHPNLASFNGHLRTTAIEFFNENEIQYTISDLYQTKFKASADEMEVSLMT